MVEMVETDEHCSNWRESMVETPSEVETTHKVATEFLAILG